MPKLVNIPEAYKPAVDELPGELSWIAEAIEEHWPGQGVDITLMLAQVFRGQEFYIRGAEEFILKVRDDAIREAHASGVRVKDLAMENNLATRTIRRILATPSKQSQEELKKKQGKLW